jgi:uncharacterized protein (TIGR02284 family)
MNTNHSEAIEAINDLIQINYDRIAGYEKAISEMSSTNSSVTLAAFNEYLNDSRRNVSELSEFVRTLGGIPTDSSTISGKIHRVWMDIKNTFSSIAESKESALKSCIFGDKAAITAYEAALADETNKFSLAQHVVLKKQLATIQVAHAANEVHEKSIG